ncbi:MAG: hypothetical protein HQM14_21265 [SAR324 cluster bacterium]|nr:hypothetical protein [SAR324 cluster bacterium]
MAEKKTLESNFSFRSYFLALISYLGILSLVPIIVNKEDEYVHFHARQGLVLWIWSVLAIFGLYVPVLGKFFFGFSAFIILVFSLIGILSVLFTKAWKLPFIGDMARIL